MNTATATKTPKVLATAVAALVAALACASAVHAAEPVQVPPPLKATRFVSNGLSVADAFSIAIELCVRRIEARAADIDRQHREISRENCRSRRGE